MTPARSNPSQPPRLPPAGVEVVFDWTDTHWGSQVMAVRDPDGRLIRLEAPQPR